MEYIHWADRDNNPLVSRLGFGTTRFNQADLISEQGISKCVELVEYAIAKGINYFDVAPTYSNGQAERILGKAFERSNAKTYIAAKTGLMIDMTSDDVLRRIETSLKLLHKDSIEFFHIWSVMNWEQYLEISKWGGILDGTRKAKETGMIEHLCISLHCDPETTLKILDEGIFEGITISLNAMNYHKWGPVLKKTSEDKIAVATMNSLGGGMIPNYKNLFYDLDNSNDPVAQKALRFVLQIPGVHIALSGMPTKAIIDENCRAIDHVNDFASNPDFRIPVNENLCSGCNYCAPCTVDIPISACMQAYNHRILVESGGLDQGLQQTANEIFTRIRANGVAFPELKRCIGCHVCEKRCTQKINISNRMRWLDKESQTYGYNKESMKQRLNDLEGKCKEYNRIAIWPAADYASRVFDYWKNKKFEEKCIFVNASSAMWGKDYRGKRILSPEAIKSKQIEVIVIMHHRLQQIIYNDLVAKYPEIRIICLHEDSDIDWFNRMI